MIDQNRDGFIDKEDLHDMLASLGKGEYKMRKNNICWQSCLTAENQKNIMTI